MPERRHLTVLFSDIVGFSALSSRLDPEDLRDLIRLYQKMCTSEIERFGGLVTRYVGDGIIALFGFPRVHEDDPERATNAGLVIVDSFRSLDMKLETEVAVRLAVRIGIATGLVVAGDLIGEGVSEEAAVVGETPNLAARLQQIAQPNSVVIHDSTKKLAGAHFEYKDLGPQNLPGFTEPVSAWQVLGRRFGRSRFEAAHPANLTPLVGRETDLLALFERWNLAAEGHGQVVLLTGEAGVGKSRIAQTLDERLESQGHERIRYQCSSYHQDSALHPFIEQLEWAAGLVNSDTSIEKLNRIEALVKNSGLDLGAAMPILVRLLSIPDDGRYPLGAMGSPQRKERTLRILVDCLQQAAGSKPLLVIFEDIQWADPTSLDLIHRMVDSVRSERILLVITYRPTKFKPPWKDIPHVSEMELERLCPQDATRLAASVARGALPASFIDEIVARTDGVPLFIEEVTRAVSTRQALGDRAQSVGELSVPGTLQATLAARLDQVGDAKEFALFGATIGRSFSYALLAAATESPAKGLQDGLSRLVYSGLLYQDGEPPQATYSFKHALLQDAAYGSLMRSRRRELHGRIADVMVSQFPELVENQPEVVAYHYSKALRFPESTNYWFIAGKAAIERSANKEAEAHLRNALAALSEWLSHLRRSAKEGDRIPDERIVAELELPIQLNLGVALTALEGFASPNVEVAYARARELCAAVGDGPETFYALCGLGSFYTVRADLDTARDVAQRMLELGRTNEDVALLLWGHVALGVTQLHSGQFESAKLHLEKGVAVYDPGLHGHHGFVFGQDAGIIGRCHLAWSAWLMGDPNEATDHMSLALRLADQLSHAFSHAYALTFAAWLAQFLGKSADCALWADAAIANAQEQRFPLILGMALVAKGWAIANDGDAGTGVETIREGIALYESTGAELGKPAMLALLALATAKSGALGKGLETAESALQLAVHSGQLLFKAELHRLIAELTLESVEWLPKDAQSQMRQAARQSARVAVDTAGRQGARTLMLRAALTNLRTASTPQDRACGLSDLVRVCSQFEENSALQEYKMARHFINQDK